MRTAISWSKAFYAHSLTESELSHKSANSELRAMALSNTASAKLGNTEQV